jgi:hypothetical protein
MRLLTNFLKSSVVAVLLVSGLLCAGDRVDAAKPLASNCMSRVCTEVILDSAGIEDACFITNSSPYAVIAYVAVSPWPYGSTGTLGPILLGVFDQRRVFGWTLGRHDWRTYKCFIISVQ